MTPIICRLLPAPPDGLEEKPGDMWYCPWLVDGIREDGGLLSPQYHSEHKAKRPPICVSLPGGGNWVVDSRTSDGKGYWNVQGDPPNLTVEPSIKTHNFHGWLRNGVITQA